MLIEIFYSAEKMERVTEIDKHRLIDTYVKLLADKIPIFFDNLSASAIIHLLNHWNFDAPKLVVPQLHVLLNEN